MLQGSKTRVEPGTSGTQGNSSGQLRIRSHRESLREQQFQGYNIFFFQPSEYGMVGSL
jgi:hypothetical protein